MGMGLFKRAGKGVAACGVTKERRTRRWQSCLFVAGVLFLPGLVILGGVVSAIYGMTVQWELDALEASIRAKGEPVTEVEWQIFLANALEAEPKAQKYIRPLALISAVPDEDAMDRFFPLSIQTYVSRAAFPDNELHQACEYLEVRRHVLDALSDTGDDTQDLKLAADWDVIPFRALRQIEELIWTKGFMALHDRDWESFVDSQEQLLDFSETFAQADRGIIAVRHGIDLLSNAIETRELPAEFYGQLADLYGRIDIQELLRCYLIYHRAGFPTALREYYAGEEIESYLEAGASMHTCFYRRIGGIPGYRGLTVEDIERHVVFDTRVLEDDGKPWRERYLNSIVRQPFVEQHRMLDDPDPPPPAQVIDRVGKVLFPHNYYNWWARRSIDSDGRLALRSLSIEDAYEFFFQPESHADGHLIFDVDDPTERYISFEFRLRAVRLAMLIDAYRQHTGALPDSLNALDSVAVAAIGGDPYVDGPLGYRVVEGGFLVYSVGPDLVDDGADYKRFVMGDLVERFVKEKPVESSNDRRGRGRDVQPTRPSLTLGPVKPKEVAE
jgi:hypothetical protein